MPSTSPADHYPISLLAAVLPAGRLPNTMGGHLTESISLNGVPSSLMHHVTEQQCDWQLSHDFELPRAGSETASVQSAWRDISPYDGDALSTAPL